MMKAILTVLGAVSGFVLGVILYAIIAYHLCPALIEAAQGVWTDYGSIIFGVVGAVTGAVMVWAIQALLSVRRLDAFMVRKFQGLGSLSKRESQA